MRERGGRMRNFARERKRVCEREGGGRMKERERVQERVQGGDERVREGGLER